MANATNQTLVGTAPASVTYTLMNRTSTEAVFADRRRGVSSLAGSLKLVSAPIKDSRGRSNGKYRCGIKLIEPVVRNVNGIDELRTPIMYTGEFRVSEDATDAEKAHVLKLAQSALANALFGASYASGEAFF